MAEFFDYDPLTGVRIDADFRDDGFTFYHSQDVEPLLDRLERLRNSGAKDRGIKESWFHIADIPPVIYLEIKQKYNCDLFTKDDAEFTRFLQIIERDYPKLKTTHKKIA